MRPGAFILLVLTALPACAVQYTSTVHAADQPIPGAGVTATQGDKKLQTYTDENGRFHLDLPQGEWDIRVEMFEFAPATDHVTASFLPLQKDWTLAGVKMTHREGSIAEVPADNLRDRSRFSRQDARCCRAAW